MDSSAISWLSKMVLDDPIFTDEFDLMDGLDDEWAGLLGPDMDSPPSLSPDPKNSSTSSTLVNIPSTNSITSLSSFPAKSNHLPEQPPPKLQKPSGFSGFSSAAGLVGPDHQPSSTPIILNFGATNQSPSNNPPADVRAGPMDGDEEGGGTVVEAGTKPDEASNRAQNAKRKAGRASKGPQTYDHIVAERKRREQLSQRFVTLSTIVPGLKKMDKTSVLGDAIKYLKYLQERVKILEEKTTRKMMESVAYVRKSGANAKDYDLFEDKIRGPDEQTLPEIEARVCGSQILIRVHCENRRGLLANMMSLVENLSLTIVNTNVTTFACLALDITIITEMGKEFNLTTNQVVRRFRAIIEEIM